MISGRFSKTSEVFGFQNLTIAIVTWNVGNEEPFSGAHAKKLDSLIPPDVDIFVFGTQECKYKKGAVNDVDSDEGEGENQEKPRNAKKPDGEHSLLGNHFDKIVKSAGKKRDMVVLKRAKLLEMQINVLVRSQLKSHCKEIKVAVEATGLMGVYGSSLSIF